MCVLAAAKLIYAIGGNGGRRSGERRVGEERRTRWSPYHLKKKKEDYDTLMTIEKDTNGKQFFAPAHTRTMHKRNLQKYNLNLTKGKHMPYFTPRHSVKHADVG